MKPTKKNVLLMLRESNAIEGVYGRTALVDAHRAWKFLISQDELCTECILIAHRLLMAHQDLDNRYKGNWRDKPVTIGGELKSQPKIVLDSLMRDFCDDINHKVTTRNLNADPVSDHVRFETIHPFLDGNGRMGRMLLNWQLIKLGAPLLVYTEQDKHTYYMLFPSYRRAYMDRVLWKPMLNDFKRDFTSEWPKE